MGIFTGVYEMVKKIKLAACAALAMSVVLSSTAFADVIYAPGIKGQSETGPTGQSTDTQNSQSTPNQSAGTQTQTTQSTGAAIGHLPDRAA